MTKKEVNSMYSNLKELLIKSIDCITVLEIDPGDYKVVWLSQKQIQEAKEAAKRLLNNNIIEMVSEFNNIKKGKEK